MTEIANDPIVVSLREQITANDRDIVEAVNRRLHLVSQLQDHKAARNYDRVDSTREDWLVSHLADENAGPLSEDGLRELVATLLDLTKRELSFGAPAGSRD